MPRLQRLILSPEQFQGQLITLNSEQERYLIKVLRLKQSDRFIAMDGLGHWWLAELTTPPQAQLVNQIDINNELSVSLILIAAPPKGNGFDTVIHCATELGVQAIFPLSCERSLNLPSSTKIQRWRKIATEATEQSLRQIVPRISAPLRFHDLDNAVHPWNQPQSLTFFCSTQSSLPHLHTLLLATLSRSEVKQITILTGPEGGWTAREEAQLSQQGFIGISLGKRILRAVTAPINALSIVAAFCETHPF